MGCRWEINVIYQIEGSGKFVSCRDIVQSGIVRLKFYLLSYIANTHSKELPCPCKKLQDSCMQLCSMKVVYPQIYSLWQSLLHSPNKMCHIC